ncbi:unnamed protein product [Adineta steineri]|uniref:Uncharacterized protein n=1 Tax=Adineta steineri TaxID=433720 RepID=A0A814XRL3_9BILA|nr:unnamed protein product [Adineta steineri]CAF1219448.1 unnamed protein product [Adineta steineri]
MVPAVSVLDCLTWDCAPSIIWSKRILEQVLKLSRTGIFTIYAANVNLFIRLLNEYIPILVTNGEDTVKIYVPQPIQRIQNTEKVAFVKNVDIEIPQSGIIKALKNIGLHAIDLL